MIVGIAASRPQPLTIGRVAQLPMNRFRPLDGFYEPSGIQQLPDGRFLVVEDEKSHPFSVLTIDREGPIKRISLGPGLLELFSDFWQLDDLEGVTLDRAGFVYAITSHSRDDEGREHKARERLVRFQVDGDGVAKAQVFEGLKDALTSKDSLLAEAAAVRDVKTKGGLNIEALEVSADRQGLFIGFRSPLRAGRALIAHLENPAAIFERNEAPRLSAPLIELDLEGQGIRSLAHVPTLGYLVVAGPVERRGPFALWLWDGSPAGTVCRMVIEGLNTLAHTEGVSAAAIDGKAHLMLVSDDGDRKARRPAQYLLVDIDRLRTL